MTGNGVRLQPGPRKGRWARATAYIHGWATKPRVCVWSHAVAPVALPTGGRWWARTGVRARQRVWVGVLFSLQNRRIISLLVAPRRVTKTLAEAILIN